MEQIAKRKNRDNAREKRKQEQERKQQEQERKQQERAQKRNERERKTEKEKKKSQKGEKKGEKEVDEEKDSDDEPLAVTLRTRRTMKRVGDQKQDNEAVEEKNEGQGKKGKGENPVGPEGREKDNSKVIFEDAEINISEEEEADVSTSTDTSSNESWDYEGDTSEEKTIELGQTVYVLDKNKGNHIQVYAVTVDTIDTTEVDSYMVTFVKNKKQAYSYHVNELYISRAAATKAKKYYD